MVLLLLIPLELPAHAIGFFLAKVPDLVYVVWHEADEYQRESDRDDALDDEKPAPSLQAMDTVELKDADSQKRAKR